MNMNTMDQKKKVLVAMSGGVDSSAAALLLMQQGYACDGAMLRPMTPPTPAAWLTDWA